MSLNFSYPYLEKIEIDPYQKVLIILLQIIFVFKYIFCDGIHDPFI